MNYRSIYEFTCTEYSSDNVDNIEREKLYYKARIDATDFNLEELLLSMEDFLRASGYDWIEPHSLNIEGYDSQSDKQMTQAEFDEFKEMLDKIGVKAPSVVPTPAEPTAMEIHERMMGIDTTAKIVSFPRNGVDVPVDSFETIEPEIDMTVEFDYDENIFSEDNDFSQYQYIIKEEEPKNE